MTAFTKLRKAIPEGLGLIAFAATLAFAPVRLAAQWSIGNLNSPNVITFDATTAGVVNGAYDGSGFTTAPADGQLNSGAWAATGMSDGDLAFSATRTTSGTDYTRGTSGAAGGVATSGFYAFDASNIGSVAFGIKPGNSDWTPGTVTLRMQNTTGAEMNSIDIAYALWVNNSQPRSNSFNFSYSTNNSTYSTVTALNYSSTAAANASGYVVNNKSTTITNLHIANNAYFYLRWTGDDVSGSGNRDEFALDDISVTIHTTATVLLAGPLTAFGAQCRNAGPYGPNSFTITGANLTTANVTVGALSGYTYSTTAGGTYTTSLSLTHPAGNYSQTIYVKFTPTAVLAYNGNIAVGGGGAGSVNVAASGSGVNTAPTATTGSASAITVNTATVAGQVNTTGCTAVTAYGIEYSTSTGFTPGSGTQVASGNLSGINFSSALSGLASCTAYYFRAYATNGGGTTYGPQGNFSTTPTTATVGSDRSICANTTTTSLGGNTPAAGTGAWSVVSGGTGTFSNAASGSSTFTHTGGAGPITLRWTISNAPCPASFDELVVTLNPFGNPVSQTFNANGTYNVPAGVTQISVEAWGGGGSGGGANNASGLTARGGAGGGGGAYAMKVLTVTPGSVLNVSVGAAVSGTAAGTGTNGNPTTITGFTGQIYAAGGSGGAANITGNTPVGGAGGTTAASQGDTKVAGAAGSNGATGLGISSGTGGAGANGGGAGGSAITTGTANGDVGDAPGGGGGGSRTSLTGGNTTGGSGAAGRMIITYTPVAGLSATATSICQGSSVTLTATGGGTYLWSPGGATTPSITVSPATTTNYSVVVTNICSATLNQSIAVTPAPSATISYAGSPYCASAGSANVTLTGTTGGAYSASPAGLSLNSTTGQVTLGSSTPGAYTVTYTIAATGACGLFTTTAGITVTATPSATISYTGSPYCQSGGTASVTFTGTTGGTYTAVPAGLSINSASGLVTLASSTPAVYTVTYTVAAAGGCAIFSTTAGITINATQTFYADTDGDGYGDPASSITSCVPVAGYVANNSDNCPTLFGLMGDACDDGDANTTNDLIDGSCVCAGTNAPWYSQGSGTFSDPIWSHNIGGPGTAQSLNSGSDVVIQAGHAMTITGAQNVHDLSVKATASLGLGTFTMTVNGNSVDIDGSLNGGTGTLKLQPTGAATLDGSGTLDLYNLTVDASSGLNCLAAAPIRGTLSLMNGAFTATGAVSLVSTASGTGRLGPVAGGASYIGNMTVQRYIPGGHTNWRFLGSPVAGQTVNAWKDDFFTAGFPGSHYPNFFSPAGSGIFWPSIRYYKETNTYAAADSGIVGVSSNTQALAAGQGFMAWSGDNLSTTNAFTVDVTGAPNIAGTPITLPMTYTSSSNNAMDGWNLVSNPLPSAIDFDAINRGGDVPAQYWVFNPATGMEQTYSAGIGQGAVNGVIPSSQAFWVKANGSNVTTTVSESAKVSDLTGGVFGGDVQAVRPILRLTIASSINSFSDEATFVFDEGTPGLDPEDALKFTFHTTGAPQVAAQGINGDHMAIEFYGAYTTAISIPVLVKADVTGTYTITAGLGGMQNLSCLTLEDLSNGTITPIDDGASYSFTIDAAADGNIPRFMLHGTMPLPLTVQSPVCGDGQGHASLVITNGPVDITWTLANGSALSSQTGVMDSMVTLPDLGTGNYSVHVSPIGACGQLSSDFSVVIPEAIVAQENVNTPTTCPNSEDGSISVDANGGTGELGFVWDDGTIGPDFTGAAGEHQVTVTDTVGCSTMETYTVAAGEGAVASFSAGVAVAGQPVAFTNTSSNSVSSAWDFGDGSTSTEMDPVHIYAEAGSYTVTLTAEDGTCTDISTQTITVDLSTGVTPESTTNTINVYATQKQLVIDHAFGNAPVDVDVYDASGRIALHRDGIVQPGHITLSDQELGTAVWFVHVRSGVTERTFRVPLVR